jgi:Cytidylate kinase-like family
MNPTARSVARVTDALARAQQHWRTRSQQVPADGKASGVTIALTREAGVPGTTIAYAIGQRLGWPVYDHELLERISQETGWRVNLLETVDKGRRNWLQESVEMFASVPMVSDSAYVRHLIETILSLGTHGECVIVERGAAQILPYESTLRVRLLAEREDRIAAISRRFNVSPRAAVDKMQEIDRQRATFIAEHFQKDVAEPHQYDLLLNCSRWSVDRCVDLMIDAVQRVSGPSPGGTGTPAIQSASQ